MAYQNLWSYDAVGNRMGASKNTELAPGSTASAPVWVHTTLVQSAFNANDQLTSSTSTFDKQTPQTQTYAYDANGAEAGTSSASGTSSNAWNFEGKLTSTAYADANGNVTGGAANSFDAQGDRLSRVDKVGTANQKTTSYLVDSDTSYSQVIEERAPDVSDAQGAAGLQARYVWGAGLAPLAMWRKMPDGSTKLFFHIADGQESVRQLTDASGAVADSYFYDAWGNSLAGSTNNVVNPFRYTGQQLDSDGRYYLRARFYSPGNGRFLSHDPLMGSDSDPVSLHRYVYASEDGVNVCDPSGKAGELCDVLAAITDDEVMDAFHDTVVLGAKKWIETKVKDFVLDKIKDAVASALMDFVAQCFRLKHKYPNDSMHWAEIDGIELVVSFASSFIDPGKGIFQKSIAGGLSNVITPYIVYEIESHWNPQGLPTDGIKPPTTADNIINFLLGMIGASMGEMGSQMAQDEALAKDIKAAGDNPQETQEITEWVFTFMDQFLENVVAQGVSDAWSDIEEESDEASRRRPEMPIAR